MKSEQFRDCVRFYRDRLGSPVWWEEPGLVCPGFGSGELMVEGLDLAAPGAKSVAQNPTVLRLHVRDIDRADADADADADAGLGRAGVAVQVLHFRRGVIGAFVNPDGNP